MEATLYHRLARASGSEAFVVSDGTPEGNALAVKQFQEIGASIIYTKFPEGIEPTAQDRAIMVEGYIPIRPETRVGGHEMPPPINALELKHAIQNPVTVDRPAEFPLLEALKQKPSKGKLFRNDPNAKWLTDGQKN